MGQRLVISVKEKGEEIACLYYHWSAYSYSALWETEKLLKYLEENKDVEAIYAYPGNGGMKDDAILVPGSATDVEGVVNFAKSNSIDYVVVTPDDPLVLGMVDALEAVGIPCFGPRGNAAIIEGSKVFSKNLMKKYGIPTAEYEVFDDVNKALAYVETCPIPTVIKADGLALGKGVVIAMTRDEAKQAVISCMSDHQFGKSGDHIVIEEFLTGPEVSVLSFTDGKTVVPMVSSNFRPMIALPSSSTLKLSSLR